jgi:LPXTG-motif cell wall-anchored protein
LAIGQTDRLADFGYTGDHTIGDLVWLDVDADGNGPDTPAPDTDASEPGVPGQPIAARWAGRDGTLDTVDDVTFATVDTDADGRWEITGVPDGLVRVTMTGGPSADFDITFDRDSTLDGVNEVTIDADDLDFDFGLAGRGSVGDLVWLDFVNDDIAGPSEPRIPGVSITATWAGFDGLLLTASDNVVYPSVLTDAAGLYTVGNLPAGDVRVVVDPATIPTGLFPSFDLDGGNDQQAVRTLAVAEDATDVDFGYLAEGELGDFVWWDLNGDGLQDASEPGLPGVTVTLTWDGFGSGATPRIAGGTVETTTDADGRYLFSGLPDGAYTVTVDVATLPPGLSITADPDGGDDSTSTLTLTSPDDNVNLDQDFGYVGALSIGDLVWSDVNRDGTRQPAEPAIAGAGITVTYLGSTSGTGDDVVVFDDATRPTRFALDTSVGPFIAAFLGGTPLPTEPSYLAGGLAPGTYRVTLDPATLPADFTPLSDRDGGDPAVTTLTLLAEDVDDADFAVFRNDAPAIVLPPTGNGVCGGTLTVDPLAGIDDPNGDTVSVVPGSIVAPAGVTVTLRPDGQLDIVTASSVTSDYTITWQVVDQRGAVTSVTLAVAITCFTVDIQSSCASNVPSISWAIVATGGTVTAPVSITWSDGGGNTQTDTGFGLVGTAPWPSAQWARKALDVTFTTADGAVVGPQLVAYLCELPATGSDVTQMLRAAFGLLLAGVAIMFATRRRNRFAR